MPSTRRQLGLVAALKRPRQLLAELNLPWLFQMSFGPLYSEHSVRYDSWQVARVARGVVPCLPLCWLCSAASYSDLHTR